MIKETNPILITDERNDIANFVERPNGYVKGCFCFNCKDYTEFIQNRSFKKKTLKPIKKETNNMHYLFYVTIWAEFSKENNKNVTPKPVMIRETHHQFHSSGSDLKQEMLLALTDKEKEAGKGGRFIVHIVQASANQY